MVFCLVDKVQLMLQVREIAMFFHVHCILLLQVYLQSLILIHVGWPNVSTRTCIHTLEQAVLGTTPLTAHLTLARLRSRFWLRSSSCRLFSILTSRFASSLPRLPSICCTRCISTYMKWREVLLSMKRVFAWSILHVVTLTIPNVCLYIYIHTLTAEILLCTPLSSSSISTVWDRAVCRRSYNTEIELLQNTVYLCCLSMKWLLIYQHTYP